MQFSSNLPPGLITIFHIYTKNNFNWTQYLSFCWMRKRRNLVSTVGLPSLNLSSPHNNRKTIIISMRGVRGQDHNHHLETFSYTNTWIFYLPHHLLSRREDSLGWQSSLSFIILSLSLSLQVATSLLSPPLNISFSAAHSYFLL